MQRSTSRSRGVSDSTSRSDSVRCLRAAVSSRRTPVSSAGGRCVSSRSTPRITASSRCSEQSLATQPQAPAWRARAARRGSSFSASTTVRTAGWPERTPATSEMPSTRPSAPPPSGTARATGTVADVAQVRVDEHHIEPAPLGRAPLQAAQRGGAAAGRGDVHVGLGGQGRGERLGEDAMVVHHENSDTYQVTPPGSGDGPVRVRRPEPGSPQSHGRRRALSTTPPRATYPTVSPPDQHRPPPVLCISVGPRAESGRHFAELIAPGPLRGVCGCLG